jgi:5-methylcytosine-specific restriction protein A
MTTREELKPTKKFLIIDLLKSLGMDVSAWAKFKGGSARAASNPKFCYNWSFIQPGEFVVMCLWYRRLRNKKQRLYYEIKHSEWRRDRAEPGTRSINKRANDLDRHIWEAYSQLLPIRVIFVNESPREDAKVKVAARLLDEVPWAVTLYDLKSGQCVLERGVEPLPETISAEDLELSGFEGVQRIRFVIHRRREGELRRRKIEQTMLNGEAHMRGSKMRF